MKYIKYILILLCLIMHPAFADDGIYRIDLIVFSHVNQQVLDSESWPNILKTPVIKNVSEITPTQKLGLIKEANKLSAQPDYKILLHTSWLQNINDTKWIHIYGGQPYDAKGQPIQPDDNRMPTYWELNGKIKITKATFFDIYTDLHLTIPTSDGKNIVPLRTFSLQQHRRTKLNQLNYLDHPLFGTLIKISKNKL
ncbi:MAG: CsiV family protein [Gammaproteobacteria bacterium]